MGSVTKSIGSVVKNVPIAGPLVGSVLDIASDPMNALSNLDPTKVQKADATRVDNAIKSAQKQQGALGAAIAARQANPIRVADITNSNLNDLGAGRTVAQQQGATNLLQAAAEGQTPSVAQQQLRSDTDRGISQLMAQQAASRGANPGLLARNVARGAADMQTQANQNASVLRAQEMAANLNNYASQTNQQRGQDIGLASTQGAQNLQQQTSQVQAQLAAQQAQQDALNNLYGLQNQALNSQANTATGLMNTQQGAYNQSSEARTGMIGGLLQGAGAAAGGLLTKSDERHKKNIKDGNKKVEKFLDNINAEEYEYKDKKFGEGKFISPMAQDLEKTEAGKSMVIDTPEGKMVDYGRGFATLLASQANVNNRLKDIEKALAMKGKK